MFLWIAYYPRQDKLIEITIIICSQWIYFISNAQSSAFYVSPIIWIMETCTIAQNYCTIAQNFEKLITSLRSIIKKTQAPQYVSSISVHLHSLHRLMKRLHNVYVYVDPSFQPLFFYKITLPTLEHGRINVKAHHRESTVSVFFRTVIIFSLIII